MKISLIICTYLRPKALITLLKSVCLQTKYPDEILVIDASNNDLTQNALTEKRIKNLKYFKVSENDRGLTKQRNYGINLVGKNINIVSFLDDDTILDKEYFKNLNEVFENDNSISGIGGIATNENKWKQKLQKSYNVKKFLEIDNHIIKLGQRHVLRNYLGIGSTELPGIMPKFSNGISCGYPLTGKNYEVDLLIGMSMSFRKKVVDNIKFSTYFEGYGLYEDADFSIRALKFGKNVIATNVLLEHHHAAAGRPNKFKYGKMVTRNGWYVWRVKYKKPSLIARLKWNLIAIVLILIRFVNVLTTKKRKEAFTEAIGRCYGLFTLIFNKPLVKK